MAGSILEEGPIRRIIEEEPVRRWLREFRVQREDREKREKRLEELADEEWLVWKNRNETRLRYLPENIREEILDEVHKSLVSLAKRVGA